MAFEDLWISTHSIQRLLQAPNPSHTRQLGNVRKLHIDGSNFSERRIDHVMEIAHDPQKTSADVRRAHVELVRRDIRSNSVPERNIRMFDNLTAFAGYFPQMPQMHTFKLQIAMNYPMSNDSGELWSKTLQKVVSALPQTLTSLTIDNPGEPRRSRFWGDGQTHHLLCHLNLGKDVLPLLQHLRVRVRTICPELFTKVDCPQHPHLKSIVLGLTLPMVRLRQLRRLAYSCSKTAPTIEPGSLQHQIIDAAKAAAINLPSLSTLRILHHSFPCTDLISTSILSGRNVLLPENVAWDDAYWADGDAKEV